MSTATYPTISDNLAVQQHYEESRAAGSSHRLAEMLALRQGPALSTDTRFAAGFSADPYEGMTEPMKQLCAAKARAVGVSPEGKHYNPFLARFLGDPQALISGRGDLRRVAEKRGIGLISGPVKVKPAERPPEKIQPYRVADDIVNREVDRAIEQAGEQPTPKERTAMAEQARTRLSGSNDTSPVPPIRFKE